MLGLRDSCSFRQDGQRLEGQGVRWLSRDRAFGTEGTLRAKAWRWEQIWALGGTIGGPGWLLHHEADLGE